MINNDSTPRATFGGKLGVILASVGSAVGLGNIWRFPYETGKQGGAAFLLIYLAFVLLLGIPLVIAEFSLGRRGKANSYGTFVNLAPGTRWRWLGAMGVFAGVMIIGFYVVISGWTFEYIYEAVIGNFAGKTAQEYATNFEIFSTDPLRPLLWMVLFSISTHLIITMGVKEGIERYSKVMMPLLFLFMILLSIRSITLPNAMRGIEFLFKPDFSKITTSVVLSAMGQAFFSMSIGMGCLITYASYFKQEINLVRTGAIVGLLDTAVAILAGVMIFPAVFSFGIEPTEGAELVFVTLPNVFQSLPLGSFWAMLFFSLLAIAALTSAISLHEVITSFISEQLNIKRKKAALITTSIVIVLGVISSLSLGVWSEYTIFGMNIFNTLDYLSAKILLPIGGLFIAIFVGWRQPREEFMQEITNAGKLSQPMRNVIHFILRYIAPLAILLIFLDAIL